ncbi:MAG TPA: hypothetical protein V6D14_15985 [Coleofasciculaceae cyanobacterium]
MQISSQVQQGALTQYNAPVSTAELWRTQAINSHLDRAKLTHPTIEHELI